jgi:hypothetical protein
MKEGSPAAILQFPGSAHQGELARLLVSAPKLFLILCSENIDEDAGPLVAARFV